MSDIPIKALARIAILAALLFIAVRWHSAAVNGAVESGRLAERAVWHEREGIRQSAEKQALIDRTKANEQDKAKQDAINRKVAQDHENALATLRARIARQDTALAAVGGLRVPASICAGPAGTAEAAGDRDHDAWIAGTRLLPSGIDADLRAAFGRADEVVEQMREAQHWLVEHGFYGPVPNPTPP